MTSFLVSLVSRFGLLAIVATMAAESCGIPISSEIVVPLGGALAANGQLSFVGVVGAATLGNLIGSLVAFMLARRYGEVVIIRHGRRVGLNRHHLEMARRFFDRFGLAAVFVGRLLPAIRTYISFPAGLSRMGVGPFVTLTVLGALPWNLALAYAGLLLGNNYRTIEHYLSWPTIVLAVVVVAGLVLLYLAGRRAEREDVGQVS